LIQIFVCIYTRTHAHTHIHTHAHAHTHTYIHEQTQTQTQTQTHAYTYGVFTISRLLKIIGLFCKRPYKIEYILQQRPTILWSLLLVATPYTNVKIQTSSNGRPQSSITSARVFTHTFTHTRTHVHIHIYIHRYTQTHTDTHIYTYTSVPNEAQTAGLKRDECHTHIYTLSLSHTHTYKHTHTNTHTHTHTHTYTNQYRTKLKSPASEWDEWQSRRV